MANPSLLILAGDGIGPEVMTEVKKVIAWMGDKRGAALRCQRGPRRRRRLRRARHAPDRRDHGEGPVGRRGPARRRRRPEIRPARLLGEARARPAAPAQGDGPLRQPPPRPVLRRAGRFLLAEARGRRRPRHHDRARTDLGDLFRRAARHHQGRQRARRHQHPALHRIRDRPRGALGLRTGAQAWQQGLLDGEGQRDGIGRAVARRWCRKCTTPSTPMSSFPTCMPTPARCSSAAGPSSSTSSSPTTCSATCCRTPRRC